jgi:hypothetical protein
MLLEGVRTPSDSNLLPDGYRPEVAVDGVGPLLWSVGVIINHMSCNCDTCVVCFDVNVASRMVDDDVGEFTLS